MPPKKKQPEITFKFCEKCHDYLPEAELERPVTYDGIIIYRSSGRCMQKDVETKSYYSCRTKES